MRNEKKGSEGLFGVSFAAMLMCLMSGPVVNSTGAEISLKGVVLDDAQKAVQGAIVSLAKNAILDTTDSAGKFRLELAGNPVVFDENLQIIRNRVQIRPDVITFYPSGNYSAVLELYSISGKKVAQAVSSPSSSGPLSMSVGAIAKGTYLLRIYYDNKISTFKYVNFQSNQHVLLDNKNPTMLMRSSTLSASVQSSIVDTLIIRSGTLQTVLPLKSLIDSTLQIKLQAQKAYRVIESVAEGGLWYETKTWKGGIIPDSTNDVIVNGTVYASVSGTDTSICHSLTVNPGAVLRAQAYQTRVLYIRGDLVNKGDVRNGPDYASYDNASLVVKVSGNLYQDSLYRPGVTYLTGTALQSLSLGQGDYLSGSFIDPDPSSPVIAGTDLLFRSFSLKFDTTGTPGVLDMGTKNFRLVSGGFELKNGILSTNLLLCDTLTEFTCARIKSVSGATTIRGIMRTNSITSDSSIIIDSGSTVFNLAYIDAVFNVKGDLTNNGLIRRGPGYAGYGEGNLAMVLAKNFAQNGTYTVQHTTFTGAGPHTISVGSSSILQGTYYNNQTASDLVAASAIKFKDFTLDFGTLAGKMDMGTFEPRIISGAMVIKGGQLVAATLRGDSLTTFTCKQVTAAASSVTLKGQICTDTVTIAGDCFVDTGAVFYNKGYIDAVVTVKGSFTNNGLTRRGPGYAGYNEGNLVMQIEKNFRQNGIYTVQFTRFIGTTEQTIGTDSGKIIQGLYYDMTPQSALKATTPLTIQDAKFVMSPDTINKGLFSMDTFRLTHTTGNLQVDSGVVQVDSITGGADGNTSFNIRYITTKNGTVTINKHYRTSSCAITGILVVDTDCKFYNLANIEALVTTTGTTSIKGIAGSGPGYAAYGEGLLYLNGAKLEVWR